MANTLTNLTPDLYAALDTVSRELVGFIPAVSRDSNAQRAAKGQTVRSFVTPAASASDVTPGQLPDNNGSQTIGNKTISISKSRYCPVLWNGEEQLAMDHGPGFNNILQDQFAQAMRTLVNEMEEDLAGLYLKASRAAAPEGTDLFDDTGKLKDFANVRKILADNGAPLGDLHCILGTTEGAALRGLTQLTNVNEAGNDTLLRQGLLMEPISGFRVRESAGIQDHTAGTASGATTDSSGYAAGVVEIDLASAGTGTILAGDVINFDGDDNNYIVVEGDDDVSNGGTITIAAPGLKQAIPGSATDITVVDNARRNMAFARNAIHLATRAPALPVGGDSADDSMIIQDPRSGLAFEVRLYRQYRQVKYEVAIAWGYELIKPEHCALLID